MKKNNMKMVNKKVNNMKGGKSKMKKMKFNPDKAFANFVILAHIGTISYFIYKVATCGISWMSTIGYFG